jgi:hypothetical protein
MCLSKHTCVVGVLGSGSGTAAAVLRQLADLGSPLRCRFVAVNSLSLVLQGLPPSLCSHGVQWRMTSQKASIISSCLGGKCEDPYP